MGEGEIERLRAALEEIQRVAAMCIHQNTGRWDMRIEHDRRSYGVLDGIVEKTRSALGDPAQ